MAGWLMACVGCQEGSSPHAEANRPHTDIFAGLPAPPASAAAPPEATARPLQRAMRAEIAEPYAARHALRLSRALFALRERPPLDNPVYLAIAEDGAQAALRGDWDAVAASCRGCHEQFADAVRRLSPPTQPAAETP